MKYVKRNLGWLCFTFVFVSLIFAELVFEEKINGIEQRFDDMRNYVLRFTALVITAILIPPAIAYRNGKKY